MAASGLSLTYLGSDFIICTDSEIELKPAHVVVFVGVSNDAVAKARQLQGAGTVVPRAALLQTWSSSEV